jgi:nitrile hydratase accessory protein
MQKQLDPQIANMDGDLALPRKNGELVFEAPWEARAFGLAVALNDAGAYHWRDFSQALTSETARIEQVDLDTEYYARWLTSLEKLILAHGLVTVEEIEGRVAVIADEDDHDHDHDHHDHDHH